MIKNVSYLVMLILALSCTQSRAQALAFDLLGGEREVVIPFDLVQGFIVLDVKFHKHLNTSFIFDTGAENTILFDKEIASLYRIPFVKTVQVQGPDLKFDMEAYVCRDVYMGLGPLVAIKKDIIVLEKDIMHLDDILGRDIKGLIGTSFFKGLNVEINYGRLELIVRDSRYLDERIYHRFTEIPITTKHSKSYINCKIQLSAGVDQYVKLLLDTGAGLSVLLYDDQSMEDNDELIPAGEIGQVVSGALLGYMSRMHTLEIGDFSFNNIISNLIQNDSIVKKNNVVRKKGLIGNVILARFDIILDYLHNKLYLAPHRDYNEAFKYDKSGLEIYATGLDHNRYLINRVNKFSPAYFAGLSKGDIITRINGRAMKYIGMDGVNKLMTRDVGTHVSLTVERNGVVLPTKHFTLFDYLLPMDRNMKYIWFSKIAYHIY